MKFLRPTRKGVFLLLAALVFFSQCGATVSAMSDEQRKLFRENINYYDINACGNQVDASGNTSASGQDDGIIGDTYILGDSITEQATQAYRDAFKEVHANVTIDASGSRALNSPGQTGNKLTGMQAIKHDKDDIKKAKIIVVALGTNGGNSEKSVADAIDAIHKYNNDKSTQIYWVDAIAVGRPDEARFNRTIIKPGNRAVYSVSKKKNFNVISWYNIVDKAGDPQNPSNDVQDKPGYINNSDSLGVHPTEKGKQALATMLITGLGQPETINNTSPAGELLNGCCSSSGGAIDTKSEVPDADIPGLHPEDKIWNYLIAQGLTPVQAAGIFGNIGVEGVFDPQNIENPAGRTKDPSNLTKDGWGLIGFTPGKSIFGKPWSISGVKVTKDNVYFISTQLDVVYGYMKHGTDGATGKNILKEYVRRATSPGEAAVAFEDLVENASVPAHDKRSSIAESALKKYGDNATVNATDSHADTSTGCCPSGQGNTLSDKEKGAHVFNYFVTEEHFSNEAAAAATGNLEQESGFSTTVVNSSGYTALAQWGGSRLTGLKAKSNWQDLDVQLKYVSEELHGGWKSALNKMHSDTSIEDLTYDWVKYYEGAVDSSQPRGVQDYATRLTNAKKWLDQAGGGSNASGSGACSGTGAYKNPFRDVKQLRPERIDMGVDYAGEGPVYAIGPGTVHNLTNPGWNYGGYDAFISIELSDGPAKGKYSFMAEACIPEKDLKIGDKVTADTVICHMINPGSTGIETGWATPPGLGSGLAKTDGGGYIEGKATELGENYNDLLVSLGVPSGVQQSRMGSLPSGWPTWK
jgi:murein DD-endopeptidase MepM/ murein hydrolase activator NlpD/lysophospholipase L1-like esterase